MAGRTCVCRRVTVSCTDKRTVIVGVGSRVATAIITLGGGRKMSDRLGSYPGLHTVTGVANACHRSCRVVKKRTIERNEVGMTCLASK